MVKNRQIAENLVLLRMAVGAAGEDKNLAWWRSAFCGSMSGGWRPSSPRPSRGRSLWSARGVAILTGQWYASRNCSYIITCCDELLDELGVYGIVEKPLET